MICPSSCHWLWHSAWKGNEPTPMHVNDYRVDLFVVLCLVLNRLWKEQKLSSLFRSMLKMQPFIMQYPNLYTLISLFGYIGIFILFIIQRNIYFLVETYSLISQFHKLFGSSQLWNVPDRLCYLYCWLFVKY